MLLLCILIFCNFNEKCKNEVTLPNTLKMILDLNDIRLNVLFIDHLSFFN